MGKDSLGFVSVSDMLKENEVKVIKGDRCRSSVVSEGLVTQE